MRRQLTSLEPVAGVIPLDQRFFSMVSRDTVPDPEWRGFAFHFSAGMPPDLMQETAAKVLQVAWSRIEFAVEAEVELPSPALGHQALTQQLDERLTGKPILITGNFFGGLAIEDCLLRSQKEIERIQRR